MRLLLYESYSDSCENEGSASDGRIKKAMPSPLFALASGFWSSAASVFYYVDFGKSQTVFVFAFSFLTIACLLVYVLMRVYFPRPEGSLYKKSLTVSDKVCALHQIVNRFQASTLGLLSICFMTGIMLGAIVGLVYGMSFDKQAMSLKELPSTQLLRFELVEDSTEGAFGPSCLAETIDAYGRRVCVKLYLPQDGERLQFGETIEAKGGFENFSAASQTFYRNKRVAASVTLKEYERIERTDLYGKILDLRREALEFFDEPGAACAFLRAVLFGDRTRLDEERLREDIRAVGLSHLVAVSGSHLVIVSSAVGMALGALRIRRWRAIVIQLLFIATYIVLTGMQVSALRAAAMSLISFSSFFAGRRASSLNALSACVIIIILVSPGSLLSVSFLLSAISTLGIVVLNPLIGSWLRGGRKKPLGLAGEALSLTLSASVPALPLGAAFFSMVSLISPAANILASPFMTLICLVGLVGSFICLLFPMVTPLFIPLISFISSAFCELIAWMADLPYAALPCDLDLALGFIFALVPLIGLWLCWPRMTRLRLGLIGIIASLSILLYILFSPLYVADEIIMLNVGQGDAFVIRSEGSAILIDTGNQDKALIEALARHGIYRLDAVLLSHADDDHCGSLSALRGLVQVDTVCLSRFTLECTCDACTNLIAEAEMLVDCENIFGLQVGDRIKVGIFDCEIIWPDIFVEEGGNADSLSMLVVPCYKNKQYDNLESRYSLEDDEICPEQTAFFCGDAEYEQIEAMIEEGRLEEVCLLKVGHHGSSKALSEKALDILAPEVALISSGAGNRYGHPTRETLDLLESYNCQIFRTDTSGDLVCRFDPQGISILIPKVEWSYD